MNSNFDAVKLRIIGSTRDQSVRLASDLQTQIERTAASEMRSGNLTVTTEREHSEHMNTGATLVAVLGSHAILALAKGIQTFIAQYRNKVEIEGPRGFKMTFLGDAAGPRSVENIEAAIRAAITKR